MFAVAVARHLAAVVPGLVFDESGAAGNVFVGSMPSGPDEAVAVMPTGGFGQPSKLAYDLPTLQILVRGRRCDPVAPYEHARAIYAELHCLDGVVLDQGGHHETRVVSITGMQSDPIPLGRDDNDRHEYSLNFAAHTHAPTTHRPATPTT